MVEAVAVVEATKLPSPGNSKIRRILVRFGSKPSFGTKSIRFARTELLFFSPIALSEIYNLGMVSGPVLLNIKGQSWNFTLVDMNKKI